MTSVGAENHTEGAELHADLESELRIAQKLLKTLKNM